MKDELKCPKCESKGPFYIETKTMCKVNSSGITRARGYDHVWGDASHCECHKCHHASVVVDFKEEDKSEMTLYNVVVYETHRYEVSVLADDEDHAKNIAESMSALEMSSDPDFYELEATDVTEARDGQD